MIQHLKLFFDSLNYVVGFPCPHRNQKNYIEMDGVITWAHVFNLYLRFELPSDALEIAGDVTVAAVSSCESAMDGLTDLKKRENVEVIEPMDMSPVSQKLVMDEGIGGINSSNEQEEMGNSENDGEESEEGDEDSSIEGDSSSEDDEEYGMSSYQKEVAGKDVAWKYREKVIDEMKLKLSAELMEVWKSYKMTSFSTFFKYKRICHRDVSLVKLKEDMCDTCIR